jgi:hypothetical protein
MILDRNKISSDDDSDYYSDESFDDEEYDD